MKKKDKLWLVLDKGNDYYCVRKGDHPNISLHLHLVYKRHAHLLYTKLPTIGNPVEITRRASTK